MNPCPTKIQMTTAVGLSCLALSIATAPAQVVMVSFDWSSMGGASATAIGQCGLDCVPQPICQSGSGDTYTIGGSTLALLSIVGNADKSCAFGCVNNGTSANASTTTGVLVNINEPDTSNGITRWSFSHHMVTSAGASCSTQGCTACGNAGANGNGMHAWNLVFNLLGPMTVRLDYNHTVQRGGPIGGATSTIALASLVQTHFTEAITVNTDPTVQTSGSPEWVLPAGQYRLDFDASCTVSPGAGEGQSQNGTALTMGGITLTFSSCAPGCCPCTGDFNLSNLVTHLDIPGFVTSLLAGGACPAQNCCIGDLNADGMVDGRDLPGFVAKLLAGGAC